MYFVSAITFLNSSTVIVKFLILNLSFAIESYIFAAKIAKIAKRVAIESKFIIYVFLCVLCVLCG